MDQNTSRFQKLGISLMEIHIIYKDKTELRGDIVPDVNAQTIDISNVDADIIDASCETIYVNDILDFCSNRDAALEVIMTKLKYGGIIYIEGNDLYNISRMIFTKLIDIPSANKL